MTKKITSILIFIAFLIIYYFGSFSKIPFGDGVGFILTTEKAEMVSTATATTHFLYTNVSILIKNLFEINAILANRLLIIISAATTVLVIYLTTMELVKKNWIAITTAIVFGFSFTFWKNAEIVEVYTFNTIIIAIFYYFLIKSFFQKKGFYIIICGILLGISFSSHIQNILLIPAFLLFSFYLFNINKKAVLISLALMFLFLISLSILNYLQGLPLNSPYSSPQGTWVQNSFKKNIIEYLLDIVKALAYLLYNFNIFIIVGILGIIKLYKTEPKLFYIFFVASTFIFGFSTFYAVTDNYVFFLPFNLLFALAIGYGLNNEKILFYKKVSWICILIPLLYYSGYKIIGMTQDGKKFNHAKAYKGGLSYYLLPWMNNNVGILEFTIEKRNAPEPINWMTVSAEEYINLMKSKGYTDEQLKNF